MRYDCEPRVQPAVLVACGELHSAGGSGGRRWNSMTNSRR